MRQAEDAAFKKVRKKKRKERKVITEIEHWIRIALWICFACSGLAKRSFLQLLILHLLGSSIVLYATGKCHYKMAVFWIIFFVRCNYFPFSRRMVTAGETTKIFPCELWDLVWCLNRYVKLRNRNNMVQVSRFIVGFGRCQYVTYAMCIFLENDESHTFFL